MPSNICTEVINIFNKGELKPGYNWAHTGYNVGTSTCDFPALSRRVVHC